MAEEGEGGLITVGRYLDGKSVGKLWSIVGSGGRGMREKQQSARNVVSTGGVRVVTALVTRAQWQLSGNSEILHFCTHVFALLGEGE